VKGFLIDETIWLHIFVAEQMHSAAKLAPIIMKEIKMSTHAQFPSRPNSPPRQISLVVIAYAQYTKPPTGKGTDSARRILKVNSEEAFTLLFPSSRPALGMNFQQRDRRRLKSPTARLSDGCSA
jgi:hypothetical protein